MFIFTVGVSCLVLTNCWEGAGGWSNWKCINEK